MKTILSALAIAAASTALAVESSNTFGILRVDSDKAQTIVSIPWTDCGTGCAIKVKDVVKTANLTINDHLYYYNGSYKLWVLQSTGWVGAQSVKGENGGLVTAAEGDDSTLARGGALILVRQKTSVPFYLYGQVAWSTAENVLTTTIAARSKTLLAPPTDKDIDLNDSDYVTWTNVAPGDLILLSNGTMLQWDSSESKWGKITGFNPSTMTDTYDYAVAVLAAGQGVWYARQAATDASVTWKQLPNVAKPTGAN